MRHPVEVIELLCIEIAFFFKPKPIRSVVANGITVWGYDAHKGFTDHLGWPERVHRTDGPAIYVDPAICVNGVAGGSADWYIHGRQYTFEGFAKKLRWTEDQIVEYKLTNSI